MYFLCHSSCLSLTPSVCVTQGSACSIVTSNFSITYIQTIHAHRTGMDSLLILFSFFHSIFYLFFNFTFSFVFRFDLLSMSSEQAGNEFYKTQHSTLGLNLNIQSYVSIYYTFLRIHSFSSLFIFQHLCSYANEKLLIF